MYYGWLGQIHNGLLRIASSTRCFVFQCAHRQVNFLTYDPKLVFALIGQSGLRVDIKPLTAESVREYPPELAETLNLKPSPPQVFNQEYP